MPAYLIAIIVISSLLLAFLVFLIVISILTANMVVHPRRYSRSQQTEYNKSQGFDLGTEVLSRDPVVFIMKDGYQINGDVSLVEESKKFCILAHGHGTTREGALRYSLLFHNLGYSTVIYDERSHGDNIHKDVTMGFKEAEDLNEIINQVFEKYGQDIFLGLQGVSMGASTVLLSTQYQQKAKFIVSDCGYARIKDVISEMLSRHHLPGRLIVPWVNLWFRLFNHFSFKDSSPLNIIGANKIPILFIHGTADAFVNVNNAKLLFNGSACKKQLVLFEGAGHAESLTKDRSLYIASLKSFLEEIGG
jgi:fermentation-respiration switch protein FrsA (DUF1100 family)